MEQRQARGSDGGHSREVEVGLDCGAVDKTMEDQVAMVEPIEMESTKVEPEEERTSSAEQKTTRDQEAMAEQKSTEQRHGRPSWL